MREHSLCLLSQLVLPSLLIIGRESAKAFFGQQATYQSETEILVRRTAHTTEELIYRCGNREPFKQVVACIESHSTFAYLITEIPSCYAAEHRLVRFSTAYRHRSCAEEISCWANRLTLVEVHYLAVSIYRIRFRVYVHPFL